MTKIPLNDIVELFQDPHAARKAIMYEFDQTKVKNGDIVRIEANSTAIDPSFVTALVENGNVTGMKPGGLEQLREMAKGPGVSPS